MKSYISYMIRMGRLHDNWMIWMISMIDLEVWTWFSLRFSAHNSNNRGQLRLTRLYLVQNLEPYLSRSALEYPLEHVDDIQPS